MNKIQLLGDRCSTILCWPLPHITTNQPQVYVCPLRPEPPVPSPIPSHPSRLSQNTGLSSLCHTTNSHLLSVFHMVMCMFPYCSLNLSHSLLPPLCHKLWYNLKSCSILLPFVTRTLVSLLMFWLFFRSLWPQRLDAVKQEYVYAQVI